MQSKYLNSRARRLQSNKWHIKWELHLENCLVFGWNQCQHNLSWICSLIIFKPATTHWGITKGTQHHILSTKITNTPVCRLMQILMVYGIFGIYTALWQLAALYQYFVTSPNPTLNVFSRHRVSSFPINYDKTIDVFSRHRVFFF